MEDKNMETSAQNTELKRVLKLPTLVAQGLAYLCPACVFLYYIYNIKYNILICIYIYIFL